MFFSVILTQCEYNLIYVGLLFLLVFRSFVLPAHFDFLGVYFVPLFMSVCHVHVSLEDLMIATTTVCNHSLFKRTHMNIEK